MSSLDPSSVKCDSPGIGSVTACKKRGGALEFPSQRAQATVLGCAARPNNATQCPHVLSGLTTNRDKLTAVLHIAGLGRRFTDPLAAWAPGGKQIASPRELDQ
jgi:hypothetical protein